MIAVTSPSCTWTRQRFWTRRLRGLTILLARRAPTPPRGRESTDVAEHGRNVTRQPLLSLLESPEF